MKRADEDELIPFWKAPGFTFSIGWPPNFQPQLFNLMKGGKGSRAQSQAASANRDYLMAHGNADQKHAAQGTMVGVFKGTPKRDAPKPMHLKRPLGDESPVYVFRGESTAKAVWVILQDGPLPMQTLAERLGLPALNLRSRIKRAIDLKVFLTERTGNSAMVRLGPSKPDGL